MAPQLSVLADFLNPTQGPEQSGDFRTSPSFFITLFAIGAVVAVLGHLTRVRTLIVTGILIIFMATFLIPVFYSLTR
ncbi:MAG: hypothetical protein ABR581_07970 [Thermoleophilaceae bacterium]